LTVLVLAAVAMAGCGGNDKKDAEQAVRDFVKATNEHDANKLCEHLLSKDFIEQATGVTGGKARDTCKRQFKGLRGIKIRLVRITNTTVKDDKATVESVIESQAQSQPRSFQLKKEDGSWRLAGGAGG
jgi:Domain of unknown function (DUF4878)